MNRELRTRLHQVVTLAVVGALLWTTDAPAQTPIHLFSDRFGSASSDLGISVAVDGSDNVILAGAFQGTVGFGGGNLVSAGVDDIVVAKYNSAGVHQWSKRFGGTSSDQGVDVEVDGSGNVLVTGYFNNTVDFGGGNLVSAGGQDIFVAKYNSAGVYQWSQRFGGTSSDIGIDVEVDGSGNVLVTGFFNNTVNFGGGNLVSAGSTDIFVAKYNSAGAHQWSQRFGTTGFDAGQGAAVDGSGNVLVTGFFNGTVNFGGGNLASAGADDIYVAKYNSAGVHQWSQRFGSTSTDIGRGVEVDGSGNVLVTGYFNGTVNFGGGNLASAGGADIFVAKYTPAGVHQWSRRFGSTAADEGRAVALDVWGNVLVTGYFNGTVNFGGGNLVSAGGTDIFVAKCTSAGVHQWSQRFGSTATDEGRAVVPDGPGNVLMTGYFNGTVSFGGGNLVSAGGNDIFVAKFGPYAVEPMITSIVDIGNDQGRKVKIRFLPSARDVAASPTPILQYQVYRRDDPAPALSSLRTDATGPAALPLFVPGWTEVASVFAHGEIDYGIDVPTIADSTMTYGQYHSVFYIRAATDVPSVFYDSPPDSGHSLDNLAPAVPSNLVFTSGQLSWDVSTASDFNHFSVYGSNTSSFGSAMLIDYKALSVMDVSASPYAYYFVTATDVSGNESKPAVVNSLAGPGETPRSYVLSVSAYPNPFNPETTVRYTLPVRQPVTLTIHDVRGARVVTLVDNETQAAGPHALGWNGIDDTGTRVGSGVYFARLTSPFGTKSYKLTLLK